RAIHEEEGVGIGVHPGERAPAEQLVPPEGPLRVVAVGEVEDQVRRALETRPVVDLVAREDAGHGTAVAGPSGAFVPEREQALAHAPDEIFGLGGSNRAEREASLPMQVDPSRIEDEDLGGGIDVGEALRLPGLEAEETLLPQPHVRVELAVD